MGKGRLQGGSGLFEPITQGKTNPFGLGHDHVYDTMPKRIKLAQMGIPVLLSRSGVTQMGLDLARQLGITMIARAKGRHFEVFSGHDHMVLDEKPPVLAPSPVGRGMRD